MAEVDGHTNVGPVTVGIDTEPLRMHYGPHHDVSSLCDEVDRLRAEVAALERICADQRQRVTPKFRDQESGIYIGGPSCEHPNVIRDERCHYCGAKGDDL